MNPEDVPQADERPPSRTDHDPFHRPMRWTMQWFSDDEDVMDFRQSTTVPHNTDLRAPQDLSEWPSDSIFDILYGSIVLKKWGDKKAIEALCNMASDLGNGEYPPPSPLVNKAPNDHVDNQQGESDRPDDSITEMTDVLATIWQGLSLGKEDKSATYDAVHAREVQKVSDWLDA
jgi:hypothetical protein